MEEGRNAFKILTDKPTGRIPLGRRRHTLEVNIRMCPKDIYDNMGNWVNYALARDYWRALVNAALNLLVP